MGWVDLVTKSAGSHHISHFPGTGTAHVWSWLVAEGTVMLGHWAWDVSYAIIGSQSVEQRRANEREQLAYYLACLRSLGVSAPDFEGAWNAYSRHAAWMFLFALCPAELQPEAMWIRNAERAAAAITDLGTIDSLLR